MERKPHFLDEFVAELKKLGEFESESQRDGLRYNEHGDCIMYLSVNEAVVADRIDEFLTLYRSAIDERAIGFQLKGIQALMGEFDFTHAEVKAKIEQSEVKAVMMLLFNSIRKNPKADKRILEGYAEAGNGLTNLVAETV